MKKTILLTAILLLSLSSFAQARFGLRAGANFVDMTNLDSKKSTKMYFGAILGVKISESYTLRPEFTYSRQGATLKHAEDEIPAEDNYSEYLVEGNSKNINIDFLTISFINKITTSSNISFLVGPFVGFRIDDNLNDETWFEDAFPRLDIGLIGGLAYDISDNFSIEARYQRGLMDLIHEGDINKVGVDNYSDKSNHSETIQLGITYKFDLKQEKK